MTHEAGLAFPGQRNALVGALAEQLKAAPDQLSARVSQILEDRRRLEREVSDLRQKLATGGGAAAAEQIGNLAYIARVLPDTPAKDLKSTADQLRQGASATVICLVATDEAKASCVVSVSDDLTATHNAVDLVRLASAALAARAAAADRIWPRQAGLTPLRQKQRWRRSAPPLVADTR